MARGIQARLVEKIVQSLKLFAATRINCRYEKPFQPYSTVPRSILPASGVSAISVSPFCPGVLGMAANPKRLGETPQSLPRDRLLYESQSSISGTNRCCYIVAGILWR